MPDGLDVVLLAVALMLLPVRVGAKLSTTLLGLGSLPIAALGFPVCGLVSCTLPGLLLTLPGKGRVKQCLLGCADGRRVEGWTVRMSLGGFQK